MVSVITDLLIAALLGGMIFFPSVVAPLVFRTLPPDPAGRFLRALFPRYYLFMIVTAGIAGLLCLAGEPLQAAALLLVALSTLAVRQLLVPRLNAWRDRETDGDAGAGRRFATGHRASVLINMAQLALVAGVFVLRA